MLFSFCVYRFVKLVFAFSDQVKHWIKLWSSTFWACVWNWGWRVITQMKAFKSLYEILSVTIQLSEIYWGYFPVVLFITFFRLCKVVLTFQSMDGILKSDQESYWAVLSCGAVCYAVQGGSDFWVCGWNPKVWSFIWKLLSSTFLWCCLLCCTRWFWLLSLWMKS